MTRTAKQIMLANARGILKSMEPDRLDVGLYDKWQDELSIGLEKLTGREIQCFVYIMQSAWRRREADLRNAERERNT